MKYLKVIFTSILLLAIVSFFIVYKFKKVKHYALTIVSSRKTELNNTVKKLSSLFFFNIHGKKAGKIARRFLIKYSPGGIIIMSNNVSSKKGLKKLISSVKSLYTENGQAPPLIGIDQEGGRVRRIRWDEFNQPSAEESARKGRKYVKEQAAAVSKALKEMGFSVNFAPVCDVLTNPANKVIADRSYGSNETYVSEMIKSYIEGSSPSGIARCAKHFPGHGNVRVDSHINLPVDNSLMNELKLIPFKSAIDSNIEMIMVGHLLFPKIDKNPATFSEKIIGYLKNTLGFKGIIISDDLSMGALRKNYSLPKSVVLSLKAGTDMFIYTMIRYSSGIKLLNKTAALILNDKKALEALNKAYNKVKTFRLKYTR